MPAVFLSGCASDRGLAARLQLGLLGREVIVEEGARFFNWCLALLLDDGAERLLDDGIIEGLVVEHVGGVRGVEVDVDEFGTGTGGAELAVVAVDVDSLLGA